MWLLNLAEAIPPFFEKGAMGIRTKFSLQKLILQTYWVEQNFRDVHYMEAIFLKG
jgi:hypothetical protein